MPRKRRRRTLDEEPKTANGWWLLKLVLSLFYWGTAGVFAYVSAEAGPYSLWMLAFVVVVAGVGYAVMAAFWQGLALFFAR